MTTSPATNASNATICAIVTGHTHGLGAALAEGLLARGIRVLGLARGTHPTLGGGADASFEQTALDLSNAEALGQWLATDALCTFIGDAGSVLLFNNAGTVEPIAPAGAQDPAAIARAIALNVAAPLMLANAVAAPHAAKPGAARRIVHVSSGAARNAYAGWSIYCATKAALDHHARGVALDAQPGVRICSVAPGVIDTGMQATIRSSSEEQFPMRERFEQLKNNGQLTTPEAAAQQLIDFALSDAFGSSPTGDVRELAKA
jgi:benzil reductase ((S)-benzoin forming)